jgi:hypothetical protein
LGSASRRLQSLVRRKFSYFVFFYKIELFAMKLNHDSYKIGVFQRELLTRAGPIWSGRTCLKPELQMD